MTREHYDAQLRELDQQILDMGELIACTIEACMDGLERLDVELAQRLIGEDSRIDSRRFDIENQALLIIATQQPLAGDLRNVAAILTIATELERIGDYCEGISRLTLRMASEPPAWPQPEITIMATTTQELLRQALQAFKDRNVEQAGTVWARDDEVDALYAQVFRKMLMDMAIDKATIRRGTYMLWVAHNVERMADRVANIAERVAFVVTGDVTTFRSNIRAQILPT